MPPNWKSSTSQNNSTLKIAIIGQSQFAADVVQDITNRGHKVVAIFTIIDKNNREDVLAKFGKNNEIPVHKIKQWRRAGKSLPEILSLYKSYDIDLNVLPYCSQFIPMEVITFPKHQSICYHPSILPKHRGASSINWTLMSGDNQAGFSIFWADDGLDTGPILLQKTCPVEEDDTVDTIYKRFLYPEGVISVGEAVDMVAQGTAPCMQQDESRASYEAMLKTPQQIDFAKPASTVHNFIRGLDSVPGASCLISFNNTDCIQECILYGSTMYEHLNGRILDEMEMSKDITLITINGASNAWIGDDGLLIECGDMQIIGVKRIKINGKIKLASSLMNEDDNKINLTLEPEEKLLQDHLRVIWKNILNYDDIEDSNDFFELGASSMDVVRLVEESKELFQIQLVNEIVFLNPVFEDFFTQCIQLRRSSSGTLGGGNDVNYEGVVFEANKMTIRCPTQLFINGKFENAENCKVLETVNPHNEEVLCKVQCASRTDVDKAVRAAKKAFEQGEWSKLSARDRGKLLAKLADLMEQHKEELATLESLDSGAVYTLALKTHIGMSIDTWRYYAGWCDKIEGSTIPISSARPNKNFTFTKREPIGVCGLITPWNYPLMMLSWKMAACLAAGNTCVIKPAQVCPLTALKFAELSVKAGIPAGVINVIPGTGSVTGDALARHPEVRKLGFTGSTPIGKVIMETAASNLKKISLELGGKSPLVIFADCDLDKAVRVGMQSVFFNKGENCISAGRIFVESSIHDEFVKRVVTETKKIKIGNPLDKATNHGPQNHLAHLRKLEEYIKTGINDGAYLQLGGKRLPQRGYYFEPTIFTNVQDQMTIAHEESFGPIMIISKFKNGDLDGVIKRANKTEYGLAAGVFTNNISRAMRFADGIKAGTVFMNTYNKTDVAAPFGGCKQSGFGKDLGQKALDEYLMTKTVTMEY